MRKKKTFSSGLFPLIVGLFFIVDIGWAQEGNLPFPFPSYGSGPVEVQLYTDYFCPPCRAMEPDLEPILKELLRRNAIRLTLVDVPASQRTALFARNFLYALKENNNLEYALRVRGILMEAAVDKDMTTQERIEELFKKKRIAFSVWDPKPAFDRYNALIKENKSLSTPTCVVIRNGHKEKSFVGPVIVNKLKDMLQ